MTQQSLAPPLLASKGNHDPGSDLAPELDMSAASRSVNAAYIRAALDVKEQRDELLATIRKIKATAGDGIGMMGLFGPPVEYLREIEKTARAAIKKAKKWT
jgi:hypothetical protein